ncbi:MULTISPECIES: hypothetical protein [unclassified Saccharothrix]|uniref:hypothetical protein n=1 Tax=unclassified Saccharothrix TaxID=2593673 RepID=UPI00307D5834
MEQPQSVGELTPFARALLGVTVNAVWRLAAVSEDGAIPLPGTLVLDTDRGFVTLSYAQEGLSCRGPGRRDEIRWDTEPDLAMRGAHAAEEWLDLVPLEEAPGLPLGVQSVAGWFGVGSYVDTFALILSGRGRSLIFMTTDDFDLRPAPYDEARRRAETVARNMGLRLVEDEQRV